MQAANKSLMDTIYDMYEPEWSDRDRLERQARELELLWADFCHKLSDQVLEPLNTYNSQFPEVRVRAGAGLLPGGPRGGGGGGGMGWNKDTGETSENRWSRTRAKGQTKPIGYLNGLYINVCVCFISTVRTIGTE